jgi:hypothetical protein
MGDAAIVLAYSSVGFRKIPEKISAFSENREMLELNLSFGPSNYSGFTLKA